MEHALNFHFLFGAPTINDDYCPEAIQLGYGLKEIGHNISSNRDYWQTPKGFLFRKESKPAKCDVVVVDHRFNYSAKAWAVKNLVSSEFPCASRILLERQCGQECTPDWNRNNWLDFYDLILCTDRTEHHPSEEKIIPWQIGLIPEIAEQIKASEIKSPKNEIQYNFRVDHSLRSKAIVQLRSFVLPYTLKERIWVDQTPHPMFEPTGGRYNESYFSGINSSQIFLAIGGYISPYPFSYIFFDDKGNSKIPMRIKLERKVRQLLNSIGINVRTETVIQWDSFRLWEAIYATSAPILLDFESYGLQLPHNPLKWKHYIPFDHKKPEEFLNGIKELSSVKIAEIGTAGRTWFEEHYSPAAQASRLINILS